MNDETRNIRKESRQIFVGNVLLNLKSTKTRKRKKKKIFFRKPIFFLHKRFLKTQTFQRIVIKRFFPEGTKRFFFAQQKKNEYKITQKGKSLSAEFFF